MKGKKRQFFSFCGWLLHIKVVQLFSEETQKANPGPKMVTALFIFDKGNLISNHK